MKLEINVNGKSHHLQVQSDEKLLWILRDRLNLTGTKYGCGIASCGACMVHLDGRTAYACQLSAGQLQGKSITTIEGLSDKNSQVLQQSWIEEQTPQCGYCQSGQIMRAAELLARNSSPGRDEIVSHMNSNLCRCGTYPRIIRAIEKAAARIRGNEDA